MRYGVQHTAQLMGLAVVLVTPLAPGDLPEGESAELLTPVLSRHLGESRPVLLHKTAAEFSVTQFLGTQRSRESPQRAPSMASRHSSRVLSSSGT